MKKLLVLLFASSMLVSCYSVSYYSGDMTKDTPAVKVKNVKNHGFIAGLVQTKSSKIESSKYMEGKKDFKVKHCITFVDGLLECITCGIYTPSTTSYYLPAGK